VDPQKVSINENLTADRAGLFKKVHDHRHRDWKFWTTDGKIFVKPDPIRDVIVKIQGEDDLNQHDLETKIMIIAISYLTLKLLLS